MFYSKHKCPDLKTEINLKPRWAKAKHAEEVRVDPRHAMRISDIMNRFAAGMDPRISHNGEVEIPVDSAALTEDHYQELKRMPDIMGSNVIDINDYADLEKSFIEDCEFRRQSNQSMVKMVGDQQKQSESKSESKSE